MWSQQVLGFFLGFLIEVREKCFRLAICHQGFQVILHAIDYPPFAPFSQLLDEDQQP